MAATVAATDIGLTTTFGKVVGSVYTPLAEVTEITLPELSRDAVDFSHLTSPDGYREFKPGMADAGEVGIVYNLVPGVADDAVVRTHLGTRTVEIWRIVFPNGAKLEFRGFATAHGGAVPMEDRMTGTATFKVSGKPTLTPAV